MVGLSPLLLFHLCAIRGCSVCHFISAPSIPRFYWESTMQCVAVNSEFGNPFEVNPCVLRSLPRMIPFISCRSSIAFSPRTSKVLRLQASLHVEQWGTEGV